MHDTSEPRGIYIIAEVGRSDRRLKVGLTMRGPEARMRGIQSPGPLELLWWWGMPSATRSYLETTERKLHEVWAEYRVYGEWFTDEGRLAEFVRQPHTLCYRRCRLCDGAIHPLWISSGDRECDGCYRRRCAGCGLSEERGANLHQYAGLDPMFGLRCWKCWAAIKALGPRTHEELCAAARSNMIMPWDLMDIINEDHRLLQDSGVTHTAIDNEPQPV